MSRRVVTLVLVLLGTGALAAPPQSGAPATVWITLQPHPALPLKSPRVQIGSKVATADPNGAFRVEGVASGWVAITASAEGYQPVEQKVQLPAGGQTSVFLPLERIPGPGTVRGRITRLEGRDGAKVAVADVEVKIEDEVVARSDAEGLFVVPAAGPGPVSLKLMGTGVRPQEEVVVVPSHGETSIEVVMRKADDLQAWMRGRVRSTQGRPVVATVKIAETRIKARTKPTGDFEFRLPAGRYRVTFEARGYISQTKVVDVAAGDQALFYVDLSPLEN
ncbi:MAG: carboxypeptidase regulatory-like domain-containing protein [Myxococcaceae bacterium]|nr:carboxypeptidase regulatory-like domain-containing protein [Myxococcaceae bacterium]